MATKSGSPHILLDVKFLDSNDQTFRVFAFDAQKTVILLHDEDTLGEWRKAKAGDQIRVRVSNRFATESGLLGSTTYGTGSAGGQSLGQGGPLVG